MKKKLPKTILPAILIIGTALSSPAFADGKESDKKNSDKSKKVEISEKAQEASSDGESSSRTDSGRIKELKYDESSLYVIRTKFGYQTNIVFDGKEEIQSISLGDKSLWQLNPIGNRLYIKPIAENVSTNMTLLTDKRSYEFELKSVSGKNDGNIYVARFVYPEDMPKSSAPVYGDPVESSPENPSKQTADSESLMQAPPSPTSNMQAKSGGSYNYQYTYTGPDALAPLQVYDDGNSTFVKYDSANKIPPKAFIIGTDGKESSVDAVKNGSMLTVSGVAGELVLRAPSGEIKIYNEALSER